MYIMPFGYYLLFLSIWLLWRASKAASYRFINSEICGVYRNLLRKDRFYGDCNDAVKFMANAKRRIYRVGLYILASFITFFCAVYFTMITPGSNYRTSAWIVALVVAVFYCGAIGVQFIIPLLDLNKLKFDEENLFKLNDEL